MKDEKDKRMEAIYRFLEALQVMAMHFGIWVSEE